VRTFTSAGLPAENARFERGAELPGLAHELPVAAERLDDGVVARLRGELRGDRVPVEELHRMLLERPDAVVADDPDDLDAVRASVSNSMPEKPNAPSPSSSTTCRSGWASFAARRSPAPSRGQP
jgi:hypothetical protein